MNIIDLSIKRPIFVSMITIFLVILGALAVSRLPVDLYPDVSYPVLAVRANLEGAAPQEIEELITKRLEDVLSTVSGLEKIRSISREGSGIVILEFSSGTDIRFEEIQVRAKVANIRRSLPEEMSEPVVYRQDPDDTPIIELAVTGKRSVAEISEIADKEVARRIRQVVGVGEVNLGGEIDEEVQVELLPNELEKWKLSPQQIVQAIRQYNRNDPIGKLEGDNRLWLLRSLSEVRTVYDLGLIPVAPRNGNETVLLKDVAKITQGFVEPQRVSQINYGDGPQASVSLEILKQSGKNTVDVANAVRDAVLDIEKNLPPDVQIIVANDNSQLVKTNVADVYETLIIGAILTILVVLLFLQSPRSTITTGLALPTSVITTFAIMAVAGFTINVMTLLGLSLAIGLLIDDAIVVRENIFRHLQMNPNDPKKAAYEGTKEVILAVLATTLTIVAVFLPVGFMGGVIGQFFQQFAVTVVFAVLISTWDALTMAPLLSAHYANIANPGDEWARFGKIGRMIYGWLHKFDQWFEKLAARYRNLLSWLLPKPALALGIAGVTLALTVAGFMFVGKSFLPTQLGYTFRVQMSGPIAIPLEQVTAVSSQVNSILESFDELDFWTTSAGAGWNGSSRITLNINLKESSADTQEQLAVIRQKMRAAIDKFPGYNVRISETADPLAGATGGRFQPIAVMINGDELDEIKNIAQQVYYIMQNIPGISDVNPLEDEGLPEVRFKTDPYMAGYYNTSPTEVAENLQVWVEGNTSNALRMGDDQVPIRVSVKDGKRLSPASLLAQNIYKQDQALGDYSISLGNFLTWDSGAGPTMIVREDRQRVVRIGANLEQGAPLAKVVETLKGRLSELPMPNGYSARVTGQTEQMDELFGNVTLALGLGALFVFMILASLFESYFHPFTVMSAIPLAAIGAVAALLIYDKPLDLYGAIGMILLAGIVAKNSILLVDFAMQKCRDEGADPHSAILNTAPLRLRPILMTSFAMIAGMLPVATGLGVGGATRQSLGIATIGGVISSTFLSLIIVPNLFIFVERLRKSAFKKRMKA